MFRRIGVFVVVLLGLWTNYGWASDGVLNIAIPADPDTFDPHRTVAAATAEIAFNVYEGLVKAGPMVR